MSPARHVGSIEGRIALPSEVTDRRPMESRHLLPVTLLATLLIAYPLSIGPVTGFYLASGNEVPDWARALYSPLRWAGQHSEIIDHSCFRYVSWWSRVPLPFPVSGPHAVY